MKNNHKKLFGVAATLLMAVILTGVIACSAQPAIEPPKPPSATTPTQPPEPQPTVPEKPSQPSTEPTQPPEPSQPEARKISQDIIVSVPYWTEGDVYLGIGDNPTLVSLEKVNDTTYKKHLELAEGSQYYYSLGTLETKEVFQKRSFQETPLVRDAVIDWKNSGTVIERPSFQRGVTFGGMLWREDQINLIDDSFAKLGDYGVDHIIIIPDWFVFPDYKGTEIKPFYRTDGDFPNQTNWINPTLPDDEIIAILSKAQQDGIKVVIKPQVDPIDFGVTPEASRGALSPGDWDKWFSSYTDFILHYADMAEKYGADMLVIGTELDTATMEDNPQAPKDATTRWRNIITEVRKHYSGPLTYSVSSHGDGLGPPKIKFWDDLDYIGFEPYFGITDKNNPTIQELKEGFDTRLEKLAKPLYEKYGKPIILTEANCYSFDGVNRDPIAADIQQISSQAKSVNDLPLDLQEQADYYEALFQSVATKDWITGIYWWAWYLDSSMEWSDDWQLTDKFDPFIRKIAGQVMKKWYLKIDSN